jgi:acyl-coenzyme A synthetase/AMP-(fatty) acid ligase
MNVPAPAFPLSPQDAAILPLVMRKLDQSIAFTEAGAIDVRTFLRQVQAVAAALPERPYAINLWTDRYRFLVGFCAALLRGQTSLLTSDRSPHRLREIADDYQGAYALGGTVEEAAGLPHLAPLPAAAPADEGIPLIPADRVAAIVFTSGSTGRPVANIKPFGALMQCSLAAARRFALNEEETAAIVGMVPGQHMYGFETTILLPLHANCATFAGSPFFPHDVASALDAVPAPRFLISTPLQIKNLVASGNALAPLAAVISATAPLPVEDAKAAEAAWKTHVLEIFGATEVGSIASRRTVENECWRAYEGVQLTAESDERVIVTVPFLAAPVELADRTELIAPDTFRLLGRRSDIVKRAGKRASLSGLAAILRGIDGVEEAVFAAPPDLDSNPRSRLLAFVVAPSRDAEAIAAELRGRIEPAFLPRRLIKVDVLPRNAVGKITQAALLDLASRSEEQSAKLAPHSS